MRQSPNQSFPHPVIGNSDDALGRFEPELRRSNDRRTLSLTVERLETGNPDLSNLIQQGIASYAVRVECGSSGYRETFTGQDATMRIKIDLADLYRKVEVEAGVIALSSIPSYRPTEPHPDYQDAVFSIEPGEVLAVGPGWAFTIDTEWDPLKAPVPSIMRIRRGEDKGASIRVNLNADAKIEVVVSPEDYDEYIARKDDSPALVHAVFVLPVLTHAIASMRDDDFKESRWALRLDELLQRISVNAEDPLEAAQRLLRLPVSRALAEFREHREASNHE